MYPCCSHLLLIVNISKGLTFVANQHFLDTALETFHNAGHLSFLRPGNLGFPGEGLSGKARAREQTHQVLTFSDPGHLEWAVCPEKPFTARQSLGTTGWYPSSRSLKCIFPTL